MTNNTEAFEITTADLPDSHIVAIVKGLVDHREAGCALSSEVVDIIFECIDRGLLIFSDDVSHT